MSLLVAILGLALLAAVVLCCERPAARRPRARRPRAASGDERDELESWAREAKYREIRDAELDYRTGKLSREDYEADRRRAARGGVEILNRLERDRASGERQAQGFA